MVWLAGLLGLVAIGGVALADIFSDDDDLIGEDDPDEDGPSDVSNSETVLPLDDAGTGGVASAGPDGEDDGDGLSLTGGPGIDFLSGGPGEDDLQGGAGEDQINGYDGDDRIFGGPGDDRMTGAGGDDEIAGGGGEDVGHGGYGNDTMRGNAGDDQLFGHFGADRLDGGPGGDRLHGGQDDDTLLGGAGDDALQGAEGDDTLDGGAGSDTVFGGWGDDTLTGMESGPGRVGAADGDAATDFLNGGAGADTIIAGAGDVVTAGEDGDTIALGDWIVGGDAADLMDYDPEEDQLMLVWDTAADPDPEIEVVADPATPGLSHVIVNGTELARVHGGVTVEPDDIRLVDFADAPGLSAARS